MTDEMMISGKWFNKNTGDVVNVVNNVIDGDDMIIITDKGPIKLQDFGEYMQMSDEVYDERGKVIGKEQIDYKNMVQPKPQVSIKQTKTSKSQHLTPEPIQKETYDDQTFDDSMFESVPEPESFKSTKKSVVSNNEHIISKFFEKIKDKDKLIHIDLDTSILPINDLRTITSYMDVPTEEIAKYITEKLIDKTYISEIIYNALTQLLEKAD